MSTGSGSESSSLPLIIGNETLPELIYKAFVEAELTCTSPGILGRLPSRTSVVRSSNQRAQVLQDPFMVSVSRSMIS